MRLELQLFPDIIMNNIAPLMIIPNTQMIFLCGLDGKDMTTIMFISTKLRIIKRYSQKILKRLASYGGRLQH